MHMQRICDAEGRRRVKARPTDSPNSPASLAPNESSAACQPPAWPPCATLSTPLCTLWRKHYLRLLERAASTSAHSATYSERCFATLTASADSDTALSARLPSQRPVRTAQGGTPNSGTLLPWLISPTCPRSLFVFNGLSRQSADDGQTAVNFGSDVPSAALHCDDMCCWRSPRCDNGVMQYSASNRRAVVAAFQRWARSGHPYSYSSVILAMTGRYVNGA